MKTPPDKIDGATTLFYVIISSRHLATGNTKHWIENSLLGQPYSLAICKYEKSPEYYLFYCDEAWETLTDTSHSSINEAKDQAEYEFVGISNDWKSAGNS
jgi:hypothetical protein